MSRNALQGHDSWVKCVAISGDSLRIASGGRDKLIMIRDAVTGQPMCTLEGHEDSVVCLDLSTDGKHLVSGGGGDESAIISYYGMSVMGQLRRPCER